MGFRNVVECLKQTCVLLAWFTLAPRSAQLVVACKGAVVG